MIESESIPMFWAMFYCFLYTMKPLCFLGKDSLWLVIKTHLKSIYTWENSKSLISSL